MKVDSGIYEFGEHDISVRDGVITHLNIGHRCQRGLQYWCVGSARRGGKNLRIFDFKIHPTGNIQVNIVSLRRLKEG